MDMAVVIGSVVSTAKHESFKGSKLAIIQPIDENENPAGQAFIALDPESQCGLGEIVYWVGGGDACKLGNGTVTPADAAIVGLVDHFNADTSLTTLPGGLRNFKKTELDSRGGT